MSRLHNMFPEQHVKKIENWAHTASYLISSDFSLKLLLLQLELVHTDM